MEKVIKLLRRENGNIDICVNETLKHTILANERAIYADKIFEILDCNIGDHYSIQIENPQNKDEKIIDNFKEFLQGIISQANIMLQPKEDTFVEGSLTCSFAMENEQQTEKTNVCQN